MTPDLIAALLRESLPVRLALLDADQTGAGWYIDADGIVGVYESPNDRSLCSGVDAVRRHVSTGEAWLPCNPLEIMRHAKAIASTNPSLRYSLRTWDMDNGRVAACIHIVNQDGKEVAGIGVDGADDYDCAIALLREVVGG